MSVWETIQTFETILESFPEDVSALEALAAAYDQVGDAVRSREKSLELARLLLAQHDWPRVLVVCGRLLTASPDDEEAAQLDREARLHFDPDAKKAAAAEASKEQPRERKPLSFDMRGELDMAWLLLQENLITQTQYEEAIQTLTESRMNPNNQSVLSLLAELQHIEGIDLEAVIDFLTVHSMTPLIRLRNFEPNTEMLQLIPLERCRRLGVLPFEKVGEEYMVAVLNPVDTHMREVVESHLNGKTHYFLASPDDFLHAVEARRKLAT